MCCCRPAAAQMLNSVALRYSSARGDRSLRGLVRGHRWGPWWCVSGGSAATDDGARDTGADLARLEAVLFLAREPLTSRKLAQLAGLADGTRARTLIRELRERYDVRSSGFQVEEIAGGFQLLTRPPFGQWLRRLQPSPVETRLSAPALETLVVVAYCQPVVRADIEAVRGVQCGEILRQLLERDLVRIAGRSSELGRPFLYGTAKRFLQVFGLKHLDQLPWADQLRSRGIAQKRPVETEDDDSHDRHSSQPTDPQNEEVTPVSVTDQLTTSVASVTELDSMTVIDERRKSAVKGQTDDDALDDQEAEDEDEDEYEYVDDDEEEEDDEYEYEYVDVDEDDPDSDEEEDEDEDVGEDVGDGDSDDEVEDDDDEEEDEWEEVDDEDDGEVEWDDDEDDEWDDEELDDDELDDDEKLDEFEDDV